MIDHGTIHLRTPTWWRATSALCLGSFLVFINLYSPQPLMPELQQSYGVSTLTVNALMSLTTLALAGSLLVYGPLSDAIGRTGIMRTTLILTGLISLGLALAPNFNILLMLRLIQGFVLGGLPAVAIAWMGDRFSHRALLTAVGLYIASNSLGGISGRVVSGLMANIGGADLSFLAIGGLTLAGVVLFWWLLPTAPRPKHGAFRPRVALCQLTCHLRNPLLLGVYLLGGINFLVFINQFSFITFRLAEAPYRLTAQGLGLLFLTYLGGTLGSSLSGRFIARLPQPAVMVVGVTIMTLGTAVTLAPSLVWILTGLTINAFGFFLAHSMASSWVTRQATQARGSASALYLVFYYTGASLGSFWLAPFWHYGHWSGVVVGSWLLLMVSLTIGAWLWRSDRLTPIQDEAA